MRRTSYQFSHRPVCLSTAADAAHQPAIHRAPDRRFAPLGMLDQRAPFDAFREGSTIGFSLAPLFGLEAMQLATVPDQRRDAHQSRIVRRGASPHNTMSQH